MSKTATTHIHRLPNDLVARIAAGEVVERPASALKELIENSLDAGATHISVAMEGAGRTKLVVKDNGQGMSKVDALLSLERHATSKISSFDDLETIASFGFRGEALPSMAAVSIMTLITRSALDESGWELILEGGRLISEKPVAREVGTTIEVRDLFFNTPARFKFLKSDGTERGQCLRVVEEAAFAASHVTFEIANESSKPIVFKSGPKEREFDVLRDRLAAAWGPRWGKDVLKVFSQTPHFSVSGLVTNQTFHQGTSRSQYLYINRRPVQNRRLARAVYEAYLGQLPSQRHPGWVLFITLDPSTVDVNVHPSKREVKLTHESELFGFLLSAIKDSLNQVPFRPAPSLSSGPLPQASESNPLSYQSTRRQVDALYRPMETREFGLFDQPRSAAESIRPELADLKDPNILILGQMKKMFIVAQTESGLLLADQHAAAEKAAYERLMANMKSQEPSVQMLLVPFTWEVAISVAPRLLSSLDVWKKMGFVIEPFGGATLLVKGVPSHLGDQYDLHVLLDAMCDAVLESVEKTGPSLEHQLAASAACKASIKAGDPLDKAACLRILKELSQCEAPFTCPHGRPTVIRWGYDELEIKFRRR